MKTTSSITNKYPGHNTQKTAFSLCALPLDTPRRDNANLWKTDTTTLQVDSVVNNKLADGYRLPEKYVIHTEGPIRHGGHKVKLPSLPPATAPPSPLRTSAA